MAPSVASIVALPRETKLAEPSWPGIRRYNTHRLNSASGRAPPIEWEISYRRQEQQAA
jgi:hypothetical protein